MKTSTTSNARLFVLTVLLVGCDRPLAPGQTSQGLSFPTLLFTPPPFVPPPPACNPHSSLNAAGNGCDCQALYLVSGTLNGQPVCAPPCNPHSSPDVTGNVCDCDPGYKVVGYNGSDIYPLCGVALPCNPNSSPDATGHNCDCDPGYEVARYEGTSIYPLCRALCPAHSVRIDDSCVCDAGFYQNADGTCSECAADETLTPAGCVCSPGFYDSGDGSTEPTCVACPAGADCSLPGTTALTLEAAPGFYRTDDSSLGG